jgi:hypothetical protein
VVLVSCHRSGCPVALFQFPPDDLCDKVNDFLFYLSNYSSGIEPDNDLVNGATVEAWGKTGFGEGWS